jgi:hypothetical protein
MRAGARPQLCLQPRNIAPSKNSSIYSKTLPVRRMSQAEVRRPIVAITETIPAPPDAKHSESFAAATCELCRICFTDLLDFDGTGRQLS